MGLDQQENDLSVCLNLANECKRLNLKQIDIGNILDVSSKTVARWQTKVPIPADQLAKLVKLGIDPYFVITGRQQEIDVDILKSTLEIMLPVLPEMNDDIDIKTKMVAATYDTLIEKKHKPKS